MFVAVLYPYVYLLARTAFLERPASLIEAGRTMGLDARRAFWRIDVPLARPAIAGGIALALMETLARLHSDHQKDCSRLTSELEAFETTRAAELVRAAPAAYAAIEADPPLAERLGHAMEAIMTASMACANDPRFIALHARRQGKPAPPAAASGSAALATSTPPSSSASTPRPRPSPSSPPPTPSR